MKGEFVVKRFAMFLGCLMVVLLLAATATAEGFEHDEHYASCTQPDVCLMGGEPYEGSDIRHSANCDKPNECAWYVAPCSGVAETHYGPFRFEYDADKHWQVCENCGQRCFEDKHYASCRYPDRCMDCDGPYPGEVTYHGDFMHIERDMTHHWQACDVCGDMLEGPYAHTPSAENPAVCAECGGSMVISLEGADVSLNNPLGKLAIYRDGQLVDYTGFAKFEGADFYFVHGVIDETKAGVVRLLDTWYAFDHGRVMMGEILVPFEGGVFFFRDGTLNTNATGLIPFSTAEGSGWFVFSGGQFQPGVNGPWRDPYDGIWYYVVESEWKRITDVVPYDGAKFYFREGKMATDYTGYVTASDGIQYYVSNGQVQQEAMVWVPRTGSKYHSDMRCSNMKSPSQITMSEAIRRGFKPCDKCY